MPKLHHKLQSLTRYVNQDLRSANAKVQDPKRAVDLATATVGIALHDMPKALKMRSVIASSERNYDDRKHPYNLKVAILVSRHNVMRDADYGKLNDRYDRIADDQNAAERKLPLPRRKFLGIF